MICSLSNLSTKNPQISKSTGEVFDKDLFVKYLEINNNKHPTTQEEVSLEDLIPIKLLQNPSQTTLNSSTNSIISCLSVLKTEYDAMLLGFINNNNTRNAPIKEE